MWNKSFSVILIVLSLDFISLEHSGNENDELVGVAVCFRHGDRGPISSYPNDPFLDIKYWPDGFGQLLEKGKINQFNLGRWLRSRYYNFLSQRYSVSEIFVKSTDVDRTLTSAASNLAGLYYPENYSDTYPNWPLNLPWNPIPIHTVPEKDDDILAMAKSCRKFKELHEQILNSEGLKNILKKYENIVQLVESNTGWNITDVTTFQGLWSVFYVYKMHNASYLPDWFYDLDENELSFLAGLSFSSETYTDTLQRLKVGPLFNYLNNYFDGIYNGTNQKFLMLSAHDGTIASILNTYMAYDRNPPEFCSMIIWELYKSSSGDKYLKIWFKKNCESDSLEPVNVGNCYSTCSYNIFKQFVQTIAVDAETWEKECN
ncbi:prostatic acid phosphatase-like [Diorhabda sublineata]|uniref:prostatic acid phosphatase-like n=1 Tax=Diorhabda sublineata TaxID=1163346 RepID=UPI0024E082E2|nr:prostatic acid phosphatase-like [Diorhabda sublineata]